MDESAADPKTWLLSLAQRRRNWFESEPKVLGLSARGLSELCPVATASLTFLHDSSRANSAGPSPSCWASKPTPSPPTGSTRCCKMQTTHFTATTRRLSFSSTCSEGEHGGRWCSPLPKSKSFAKGAALWSTTKMVSLVPTLKQSLP